MTESRAVALHSRLHPRGTPEAGIKGACCRVLAPASGSVAADFEPSSVSITQPCHTAADIVSMNVKAIRTPKDLCNLDVTDGKKPEVTDLELAEDSDIFPLYHPAFKPSIPEWMRHGGQ